MEASDRAHDFVPAGLDSLGIEVDEVEMAVISGAHQMFWEPIRELLSIDTDSIVPERDIDLSRAPSP